MKLLPAASIALALIAAIAALVLLPHTLLLWLVLPVSGFGVLLVAWAYRWSNSLGDEQLNRSHVAMQTASHALTALGVLTVAFLFVEEQQWEPRLSIDVKADAQVIQSSQKRTALVQLAIAISNDGRVSETVNFIEVAALGLRDNLTQDPQEPSDLKATEFYKIRTSRSIGIGPGETEYQYVEVPVACDWRLVRFLVKVPKPPVRLRRGKEKILVYERKVLVPFDRVCEGLKDGHVIRVSATDPKNNALSPRVRNHRL